MPPEIRELLAETDGVDVIKPPSSGGGSAPEHWAAGMRAQPGRACGRVTGFWPQDCLVEDFSRKGDEAVHILLWMWSFEDAPDPKALSNVGDMPSEAWACVDLESRHVLAIFPSAGAAIDYCEDGWMWFPIVIASEFADGPFPAPSAHDPNWLYPLSAKEIQEAANVR